MSVRIGLSLYRSVSIVFRFLSRGVDYLSLYLRASPFLSVCVCVFLSISVYISLSLCVYFSVSIYVYFSIYL